STPVYKGIRKNLSSFLASSSSGFIEPLSIFRNNDALSFSVSPNCSCVSPLVILDFRMTSERLLTKILVSSNVIFLVFTIFFVLGKPVFWIFCWYLDGLPVFWIFCW